MSSVISQGLLKSHIGEWKVNNLISASTGWMTGPIVPVKRPWPYLVGHSQGIVL